MERTPASRAFYPAEPDLGLRIAGALGFFRWTIAAQNGEPLGEASSFVLQDPNDAKDVLFRFGFDDLPLRGPPPRRRHLGTARKRVSTPGTCRPARRSSGIDANEDGLVQPSELTGIPAQAADAVAELRPLGGRRRTCARTTDRGSECTKVYGEFVLAQNLDRGLYVADPIATGLDQRELGFYVAAVQEITSLRGASACATTTTIRTRTRSTSARRQLHPVLRGDQDDLAARRRSTLPDRARLLFQYDFITNAYARTRVGRADEPQGQRAGPSGCRCSCEALRALMALRRSRRLVAGGGVRRRQPANVGLTEPHRTCTGRQFISGPLPGTPRPSTAVAGPLGDGGADAGAARLPALTVTNVDFHEHRS